MFECYLNCCEDVKYSVERQYGLILCENGMSMAFVYLFLMYFIFCEKNVQIVFIVFYFIDAKTCRGSMNARLSGNVVR